MVYFLSIFVIFTLFLLLQFDKRSSVKYLVWTASFFFLSIFAMVLYLSRDVRYYNIIQDYFSLPEEIWRSMMFSSFSKDNIIRLLNLFSLLTVFFGCSFSLTYQNKNNKDVIPKVRRAIGITLGIELFLYDPLIEKGIYMFFYPFILDSEQFNVFVHVSHIISVVINNGLVIVSMLNLFQPNRSIYSFPYFKYFAYGETIGYTLIMISYLSFFNMIPNHMIRYSKISGYASYSSLPLYGEQVIYSVLPYYLLFSSVLLVISVVMLTVISRRLNRNDMTISSQVDAANSTSKTFCHYMKNEILALQAEVQLLEITPEHQEERAHIVERCQNLYDRLDILHHSTKDSKLLMQSTDLEELINKMLDRMAPDLKDVHVEVNTAGYFPPVIIDANYFEQAVQNIVTNAIDVMAELPPERKNLDFMVYAIDNWVVLAISDTGPGISKNNQTRIFEPFFSSRPIAEHWGLGLTMTYRIVKAHRGRITVESQEGEGTTFRILLPNPKELIS